MKRMANQESLYGRFAKYYDKLYLKKKDYIHEAGFIGSLIRKYNPKAKSVLDVACGTGIHMSLLRKTGYLATGVDASSEMLKLARKRLGGRTELLQADMKGFRLGKKFDVVTCMFSAINYNLGYVDLKKTIGNFYCHLGTPGLAIIDVGFFPQMWVPDFLSFDTYKGETLSIARLSKSALGKDGIADIDMLFLVKENGKVDFEIDEHRLMPFDLKKVRRIMQAAGFSKIRVHDGYSMKPWNAKSVRAVVVGSKER